ncbi:MULTISPECIES: methionine/alanine import family NSS transporter small subunit [Rossellomorea]|uniref:Putative methionine/alanine importer small subunit n=1 Tax=Rossellomorea aquimaris TaxID=189382 RepID=A0A366EVA7_9BACI|nr:methionine/alanine import family NSS transporter small subunit [Rossellomorea aquimaris]RBP05439.1 putative methionine/alanine importer small subunit [Rossellomorea aquimaris]
MTGSAIAMMIVGMVIIWGGLAASIINAVSKSKKQV